MLNDSVQVGKTDLNGFFQISIPISINKIFFSAVGIEPASIELMDKCNEAEVVMMLRGTYCFKTLKKADRLRMKTFMKLPELHREAFKKNIFKTNNTCYTREFIPDYIKK
ncbi:hypothetical protein GCM10023186_31910 [Hymenobacter koreensis]|uniref:Uncharacterized protein n=2 Tax=Hymenobacter koreensis TaxID=1084523 RepID=A0ABP8J8I6_9BACT